MLPLGKVPISGQAPRFVMFFEQHLRDPGELTQKAHVKKPGSIRGKLAGAMSFETLNLASLRQSEQAPVWNPPVFGALQHFSATLQRASQTFQP